MKNMLTQTITRPILDNHFLLFIFDSFEASIAVKAYTKSPEVKIAPIFSSLRLKVFFKFKVKIGKIKPIENYMKNNMNKKANASLVFNISI